MNARPVMLVHFVFDRSTCRVLLGTEIDDYQPPRRSCDPRKLGVHEVKVVQILSALTGPDRIIMAIPTGELQHVGDDQANTLGEPQSLRGLRGKPGLLA